MPATAVKQMFFSKKAMQASECLTVDTYYTPPYAISTNYVVDTYMDLLIVQQC